MRSTLIAAMDTVCFECEDHANANFRGDFRIKRVATPATRRAVNIVMHSAAVHRASAGRSFGWTVIREE